ncbi:hypothetical protein AE929_09550 [Xanthomonas arboricola]|uniref:Uncharacterized protein n=1 Tax=Xanthomonas campestris pv. juglandis TaxID=195709 RepID=A0A8E4ET84_XANCJ|nr:hypothetical protein [Xanthomonas arboricola]KOA98613.1 hypothetical protein AE920_15025 [Xanthomonas arboricola]KOB16862.1 hypothetical protein AE924_06875 [Xanthomonas arboricola]KOB25221.1 hypothetical protein AE927_16020 [Xanthomonas arboricola]KOB35685.1 hypothetical protein AE929_09550 [Xanthomonas arboricola]KOB45379.1 hypothetical protein AE931_05250 [Xanthomonas arboricola]
MAAEKRDSRDWTLGLASFWDMRAKLAWEVRQVESLAGRPVPIGPEYEDGAEQALLFAAANAFATAWHLMEWLAFHAEKDALWSRFERLAGRPINNKNELKSWVLEVPEMRHCCAICVATKHVSLSDPELRGLNLSIPIFFDFFVSNHGGHFRHSVQRTAHVVSEADGFRGTVTVVGLLADIQRWWDWLVAEVQLPAYPRLRN